MHPFYHSVGLGVVRCFEDVFRSHEAVKLDAQVRLELMILNSGDVLRRTKNRDPCDGGNRRIQKP